MQRSLGSALALVGLLTLTASAAQAQRTTLDFENLSNPNSNFGGGVNPQGNSVTQNGFTLTATGGSSLYSIAPNGNPGGYNYTGSVALFNTATGPTTVLTQTNGNVFTLNQIGIANLYNQTFSSGNATVDFTGALFGGGSVTQSFTLAASDALQTFTFNSSFTNLASVSFGESSASAANGYYAQYDNISVTPAAVPELSTCLGFGSFVFLGGLALLRQRKQARQAE